MDMTHKLIIGDTEQEFTGKQISVPKSENWVAKH
jgi:hypothetical protein